MISAEPMGTYPSRPRAARVVLVDYDQPLLVLQQSLKFQELGQRSADTSGCTWVCERLG